MRFTEALSGNRMLPVIAILLNQTNANIVNKPAQGLEDVQIKPDQWLVDMDDTFQKDYMLPLEADLKNLIDLGSVNVSDYKIKPVPKNKNKISFSKEDLAYHGGQSENRFMTQVLEGNNVQAFLSVFM